MNIIDESSPLIGLAHEALRELQALSEKFQAEGCNVTLIVTSRDANGLNAMAIASTIDDHEEMGETLNDIVAAFHEPYETAEEDGDPGADQMLQKKTLN